MLMLKLKQNATRKRIPVLMVSTPDQIAGYTSLSLAATLTKNGGILAELSRAD